VKLEVVDINVSNVAVIFVPPEMRTLYDKEVFKRYFNQYDSWPTKD